ncbi:hypothetical protein [Lacticaseibacillus sp. GG6-2]
MRWWWQKQGLQPASTLTPAKVLKVLPEMARKQILQLTPSVEDQPYYWQLECRDLRSDLALTPLVLPARSTAVPLTGEEVLGFAEEMTTQGLVPMYLLVVDRREINASILHQLAHGIKGRGQQVAILVPVGVLYDFLANTTVSGQRLTPTVGELLDGWPMRQSATMAAYAMDVAVASRMLAVPLPTDDIVKFSGWHNQPKGRGGEFALRN